MSRKQETRVLVDEVLAPDHAPEQAAATLVGEVLDDRHPVLQGRARVRWQDRSGHTVEQWLACLQGLTVRAGDRVLLQSAANWPEPLLIGVIDGFARRPEAPAREAARLELAADEAVTVTGADEQPLLELRQTEAGVRVKLLREDVDVELPGRLCLSAAELELRANAGDVTIAASDDVEVKGEAVRLN